MTAASTRMPPRRVVLLRHGESEGNVGGFWQGHLDVPLTALGERQAAAAAPLVAALRPDRVISSDLARARRTAEIVAGACGIRLDTDRRLREVDVGLWEGLTNAEVTARWPQERAAVLRGEDVPRGETGESMGDVARRVADWWGETEAALAPGECVVVVGHGASGRTCAATILGLDPQLAWALLAGFGNAHHSVLVEGGLGWRLESWNVPPGVETAEGTQPP